MPAAFSGDLRAVLGLHADVLDERGRSADAEEIRRQLAAVDLQE
jgi:hypothetical protein